MRFGKLIVESLACMLEVKMRRWADWCMVVGSGAGQPHLGAIHALQAASSHTARVTHSTNFAANVSKATC